MSLDSLCKIATATIMRNVSTSDATMGQIRNYTLAGRTALGLPTSSTGRLVQGGGDRRLAYEMHDLETPGKWYTLTNPQLNEADVLVINGANWFVQNQSNPDTLGRYYIITVKTFTRGLQ